MIIHYIDGGMSATWFGDKTVRHRPIRRVEYSQEEFDAYESWAIETGGMSVEAYCKFVIATQQEIDDRAEKEHQWYMAWLRTSDLIN